jgi:hypothetical protein
MRTCGSHARAHRASCATPRSRSRSPMTMITAGFFAVSPMESPASDVLASSTGAAPLDSMASNAGGFSGISLGQAFQQAAGRGAGRLPGWHCAARGRGSISDGRAPCPTRPSESPFGPSSGADGKPGGGGRGAAPECCQQVMAQERELLTVRFDTVLDKNVEQLKALNRAIFPINYQDRIYSEIVACGDVSQLAYHNDELVGAIACRLERTPEARREPAPGSREQQPRRQHPPPGLLPRLAPALASAAGHQAVHHHAGRAGPIPQHGCRCAAPAAEPRGRRAHGGAALRRGLPPCSGELSNPGLTPVR